MMCHIVCCFQKKWNVIKGVNFWHLCWFHFCPFLCDCNSQNSIWQVSDQSLIYIIIIIMIIIKCKYLHSFYFYFELSSLFIYFGQMTSHCLNVDEATVTSSGERRQCRPEGLHALSVVALTVSVHCFSGEMRGKSVFCFFGGGTLRLVDKSQYIDTLWCHKRGHWCLSQIAEYISTSTCLRPVCSRPLLLEQEEKPTRRRSFLGGGYKHRAKHDWMNALFTTAYHRLLSVTFDPLVRWSQTQLTPSSLPMFGGRD